MRRERRALLAALLVVAAAPVLARDGDFETAVVEDDEGSSFYGKTEWGKEGIEIKSREGAKTIAYRKIASVEEHAHLDPPPEKYREADRKAYAEKAAELETRKDATAAVWARLAGLALVQGLTEEMRSAAEKAIQLDPDEPHARGLLGQAKDADGKWKPVREVLTAKRAKASSEPAALREVADWASRSMLWDDAIDVLAPLVRKDPFDKDLLVALRKPTERRAQKTPLEFPLRGRWRASVDATHHHEKKAFALHAIDFAREVDGKTFKGEGKDLEDYYAFGQEIHAAADGEVVEVREGFPDNPIGKLEGKAEKHNGISLLHEGGEGTWYIHTKLGSITLKKGDKVKKGDVIARVGNSGGSAVPHLHFTLVDAYHGVSVAWRCEGWSLVAPDGTAIHVKRGRIAEGTLVEMLEEPKKPR